MGTYDNVRWAHLSHGARSHSRHHLTTCSRSSIDMATYNYRYTSLFIYLLQIGREGGEGGRILLGRALLKSKIVYIR